MRTIKRVSRFNLFQLCNGEETCVLTLVTVLGWERFVEAIREQPGVPVTITSVQIWDPIDTRAS